MKKSTKLLGLVFAFVLVGVRCIDVAADDTISGDTNCVWGAADCNRCVMNVSAELDRLQNNYQSAGRIRFASYAYPTPGYILHRFGEGNFLVDPYEHVQSIGRIAGVGNNEYMVFTHSTASDQSGKEGALAVVRMGARQNTGGNPFYGMPNGDGSNQDTSNRTVARTYVGNNHPGGLSVLGHYVYVAQWCQPHGEVDWCKASSATVHGTGFSIYEVSKANLNSSINSNPPIHLNYRHVYDELWIGSSSTASVAAVKLSSGQYLVALGASGGRKYGFYTATSPTGPFTFHSSNSIPHWGENASIVTECSTGDLYMFQIEGYGSSDDVDRVHLYKLVLNNGVIAFQYEKSRTFYCRGSRVDGAGDWCHFDAGAGMYITPSGNLILYATDWRQSSHGNIRLVEFSGDSPNTCKVGFVWREATQTDFVCVTAETRAQTQDDNNQAAARRNPDGGPYGSDTCFEGFVWREAFPGDHVCVTGETREQTMEDNRLADSRRQSSP